jgi:hypothetical protein
VDRFLSRTPAKIVVGAALLMQLRTTVPTMTDVELGTIAYGRGPMVAHGVLNYSVVVLSFNGSALFACASRTQLRGTGPEGQTEGNVVGNLIEKADELHFSPKQASALVNACDGEGLRFITDDLRKNGIRVIEADTVLEGQPRMVRYYPNAREFVVDRDTDQSLF